MSIQWNADGQHDVMKTALRNAEARARPVVEGTVCYEHGRSPKLVRREDGSLRIEDACCREVARDAAKRAGLGDITWREVS